MDLGTKNKGGPAMPVSPKSAPKFSYPSFNISDAKVDDFLEESGAELEDVVTATVKLKVTGIRKDQYGKSVSLDVLSLDDCKECEGDEADAPDETDAEEKDEEAAGKADGKTKVNKAVRKMMKEE